MKTIYVVFGSRQEASNFASLNGIHPQIVFSADNPNSLRGLRANVVQVHHSDRPDLIEPARAKRWQEAWQNIKIIEMKQ